MAVATSCAMRVAPCALEWVWSLGKSGLGSEGFEAVGLYGGEVDNGNVFLCGYLIDESGVAHVALDVGFAVRAG